MQRLIFIFVSGLLPLIASILHAEHEANQLSFVCQWTAAENREYEITINVDLTAKVADRSDDPSASYSVIKSSSDGIWLLVNGTNERVAVVQTIERSSVGGTWTDTWLINDGAGSPTRGGYCVEKDVD
ncbi:hypothetical protein [Litorivita sp. NS0012-18]|uniref:hypothetical protein n=1 Tax=Litorivita sp. NS0012-18 TaxID=3127655 RepID=UPI00310A80C1